MKEDGVGWGVGGGKDDGVICWMEGWEDDGMRDDGMNQWGKLTSVDLLQMIQSRDWYNAPPNTFAEYTSANDV